MTTDTVRQVLTPVHRAGSRARDAARDTSTAARHALLGLRMAGSAPARWATSCAAGAAHALTADGGVARAVRATGRHLSAARPRTAGAPRDATAARPAPQAAPARGGALRRRLLAPCAAAVRSTGRAAHAAYDAPARWTVAGATRVARAGAAFGGGVAGAGRTVLAGGAAVAGAAHRAWRAPGRWAVAGARGLGRTGAAFGGGAGRASRGAYRAVTGWVAAGAAGIAEAGRAVARMLSGAGRRTWRVVRTATTRTGSGLGRAAAAVPRALRRTARRARRRLPAWWPVAACALLGGLAGAGYGMLKTPAYTATSYVMVTSGDGGGPATLGYAQAYGRIATGGAVLSRAHTSALPMGALESGVEAVTSPDAPMIEITGTSDTPRRAADMANRVAHALTAIANLSSDDTGAELRVFSEALPPGSQASPSLPLSVAVGACTGGLLGALVLLVRPRRGGPRPAETVPAPTAAGPAGRPERRTRREPRNGHTHPAVKRERTAPATKTTKEEVR